MLQKIKLIQLYRWFLHENHVSNVSQVSNRRMSLQGCGKASACMHRKDDKRLHGKKEFIRWEVLFEKVFKAENECNEANKINPTCTCKHIIYGYEFTQAAALQKKIIAKR